MGDVDTVARALDARAKQAPAAMAEAIAEQSADTVRALRRAAPVDTGRLRDGWTVERTEDGVAYVNDIKYAGYNGRDDVAVEVVRRNLDLQPIAEEVKSG
jgi:hypothetical protein